MRKFRKPDGVALGQHHGAEQRVFELADVARPVEGREHAQRLRRDQADALALFGGKARQEMPGQRRDVGGAVAQRRHRDREDVQAIEQVFAKAPGFDVGDQVAIGGGDDADVDLDGFARADRLDLALLDRA